VLAARTASEVLPLVERLQEETTHGNWVAGFLAYEAGYVLEPSIFAPPADGLLGWFGVYSKPVRVSSEDADPLLSDGKTSRITNAEFGIGRGDYAERIGSIRARIAEGDVYQINFTAPFRFQLEGDAAGLYAAVRKRQRVPYGAFLNLGGEQVLSFSPELFFRVDGRQITTRPMKGTTHRSSTPAEDDHLAEALLNDEKNRAENLMIVDLLRNDLGRAAEIGSVAVTDLFTVERYPTLHQMTSGITARLRPGMPFRELLGGLFPCGSITGAPKVRAMEIIDEFETEKRGIYAGAVGYLGFSGDMDLAIAIRTAVVKDGMLYVQAGAGIVADSVPENEWAETMSKARAIFRAVAMAESGLPARDPCAHSQDSPS